MQIINHLKVNKMNYSVKNSVYILNADKYDISSALTFAD